MRLKGEFAQGTPGRAWLSPRNGVIGLVILGAALSPPGQALAERVGELIGIGNDPSIPERVAQEGESVVVGSGTAPGGQPVELVGFTVESKTGQSEIVESTCFTYDLPQAARVSGTCIEASTPAATARVLAAPSALYPESQFVVAGVTRADVDRVEVTFAGNPAPIIFGRLDEVLAAQVGSKTDAGTFVAFLPPQVDEVFLMSRDDAAEVISSVNISAFSGEELVESRDLAPDEQGGVIPIPTKEGEGTASIGVDVPLPPGTYPPGDGTTLGGGGVANLPSAFAGIGKKAPPEAVEECEQAFATGEYRGMDLDQSIVEMCAVRLAQDKGFVSAGKYSKDELAQAIKESGVVPDEYGTPFERR